MSRTSVYDPSPQLQEIHFKQQISMCVRFASEKNNYRRRKVDSSRRRESEETVDNARLTDPWELGAQRFTEKDGAVSLWNYKGGILYLELITNYNFKGNLLVILVVILSRRLRSTELFLGNLAIADFCVGVFCILQTISSYITSTWIFGNFICKLHYFMHSLSCTASIIILVVISIERYLAIMHPIRSRQIMTPRRLKLTIAMIWIISTVYSSPRFIFAKTISHSIQDDIEVICIISRVVYNSELFDVINFILLYLMPLMIMSVLYTRIAIKLWNSAQSNPSFQRCGRRCNGLRKSCKKKQQSSVIRIKFNKASSSERVSIGSPMTSCTCSDPKEWSAKSHVSYKNVLRARRGVIRMVILVVVTFAVCNASIHIRKMWQYWSHSYDASSNFSSLFTPLTFLLAYCNSAINPLLYAFLSKNFRKSMMELSLCKFRFLKSRKKSYIVEST